LNNLYGLPQILPNQEEQTAADHLQDEKKNIKEFLKIDGYNLSVD
jgi:hypothetical protein